MERDGREARHPGSCSNSGRKERKSQALGDSATRPDSTEDPSTPQPQASVSSTEVVTWKHTYGCFCVTDHDLWEMARQHPGWGAPKLLFCPVGWGGEGQADPGEPSEERHPRAPYTEERNTGRPGNPKLPGRAHQSFLLGGEESISARSRID